MKTPKAEEIKLPYASTVANFYKDQGAPAGSSFLGKLFKGGSAGAGTVTRPQAPVAAAAPSAVNLGRVMK